MTGKSSVCATCGTPLKGEYCYNCGEKASGKKDLSLKNLFKDVSKIFIDFDFKFLRSFYYLIVRPGFLTNEFLEGRRINYRKPFQLFLVINLFYFFLQPYTMVNVFNNTFESHTSDQLYSPLSQDLVNWKYGDNSSATPEYKLKFNAATDKLSRSLVILNIPLFALLVYGTAFRRKRYYMESFIFSLHFYSFVLIMITLLLLTLRLVSPELIVNDILLTGLVLAGIFTYLIRSVKNVFGFSGFGLWTITFILSFGFYLMLNIYRFILFTITLWTV